MTYGVCGVEIEIFFRKNMVFKIAAENGQITSNLTP